MPDHCAEPANYCPADGSIKEGCEIFHKLATPHLASWGDVRQTIYYFTRAQW